MKNRLSCASLAMLLMAVQAGPSDAVTIERRFPCAEPAPGTTDETYAPSFVSVKTAQDSFSRYIIGRVIWHRYSYMSYFTEKQMSPSSPFGFEIETHFYNYDNAIATGLGPAYMRGWTCETDNSVEATACQMIPTGLSFCSLPSCYQDTQAGSAKNSVGEYSQPQLAFGSFDGAMLTPTADYSFGARGASGRGNKSATKVNFQPTRQIAVGGIFWEFNQGACVFSRGSGDVELVPLGVNHLTLTRIYSPLCMGIWYKHGGVSLGYTFC